jgi:hypothetical protein
MNNKHNLVTKQSRQSFLDSSHEVGINIGIRQMSGSPWCTCRLVIAVGSRVDGHHLHLMPGSGSWKIQLRLLVFALQLPVSAAVECQSTRQVLSDNKKGHQKENGSSKKRMSEKPSYTLIPAGAHQAIHKVNSTANDCDPQD